MKNKLYYILVVLICTVCFAQRDIYTSFSSGEVSPDLYGRIDVRKYYSGCQTLENMFVWAQGPVEKRRGTYFIGEVGGDIFPAVPAVPGEAATYKITYISENAAIWGIPLNYSNYTTLTLDSGGIARNVGGGIVALPCLGHPFVEGQVIWIEGTSNYDLNHTLTAGTSDTELQFADTFGAETFDGTETVVQYISLSASAGRMAQDADGNMYFGTNIISANCITKVSDDGITIDTTYFTPDTAFTGTTCLGIKVSTNSDYLYVYTDGNRMWKFDLSDGSEVWSVLVSASTAYSGYNIDIDSSDNVYVCQSSVNLAKLAAADGTVTVFTDTKGITGIAGVYDVHVNSDMGIVLTGGWDYKLTNDTGLYNLSIRDLDDNDGIQIALGGTYESAPLWYTYVINTNFITTYEGYIYVLCNKILYKLDSDLNIIAQIDGPTSAVGIFIDLQGQIVIVNQNGAPDDILYFYDTDLNYLAQLGGFYTTMLETWSDFAWMRGNAVFDGNLGTADIPAVPAVEAFSNGLAEVPPARLLSFEDAYVIEAGAGYMRFYKDIQ